MNKIVAVIRSFQAGAGKGEKAFDSDEFMVHANGVRTLLDSGVVSSVVVVGNAEAGNPLAELPTNADGKIPTISALECMFPTEIKEGRVIPQTCLDWGNNPGSARALTMGRSVAHAHGAAWVLNWSPQLALSASNIMEAMKHAEQRSLDVVGVLRQRWWERAQWMVAQNTGALWRMSPALMEAGEKAHRCDGTGETIYIEEFGEVSVAGMDDFYTMLCMVKQNPEGFRWGMVCRANPLFWDTNFKHGSERERKHLAKVARQYRVMQAWAEEVFPELPFYATMGVLFARYHQD